MPTSTIFTLPEGFPINVQLVHKNITYTIEFDEGAGVLVCRLYGFLHDEAATRFGRELALATARVRSADQPFLFLVDNREGRVASPTAAKALAEQLNATKRPGDRTAIIVADSLSKLQAKRVTTTEHEVFLSENAARTWLTAHTQSGRTAA